MTFPERTIRNLRWMDHKVQISPTFTAFNGAASMQMWLRERARCRPSAEER